jgi:Uma2 family endonuclease
MSTETTNKKLFTVDEYHRMAEVGILPEASRFELVRGEIIEMTIPGSPHSGRVNRLTYLFVSRFGQSVIVSGQNPVTLNVQSEPMPDLALLRPRHDFYTSAHPSAEDVLLVVEISDTTVRYDSTVKAALYAEAGIPEYWLLDITRDVLVVRTDPAAGKYRNVQILRRGEAVSPQKLPAASFSIDEILG